MLRHCTATCSSESTARSSAAGSIGSADGFARGFSRRLSRPCSVVLRASRTSLSRRRARSSQSWASSRPHSSRTPSATDRSSRATPDAIEAIGVAAAAQVHRRQHQQVGRGADDRTDEGLDHPRLQCGVLDAAGDRQREQCCRRNLQGRVAEPLPPGDDEGDHQHQAEAVPLDPERPGREERQQHAGEHGQHVLRGATHRLVDGGVHRDEGGQRREEGLVAVQDHRGDLPGDAPRHRRSSRSAPGRRAPDPAPRPRGPAPAAASGRRAGPGRSCSAGSRTATSRTWRPLTRQEARAYPAGTSRWQAVRMSPIRPVMCGIVPPYLLENIARRGSERQQAAATRSLALDLVHRQARTAGRPTVTVTAPAEDGPRRTIATADGSDDAARPAGAVRGRAGDRRRRDRRGVRRSGCDLRPLPVGLRPALGRRRGPAAAGHRALRQRLRQRVLGRRSGWSSATGTASCSTGSRSRST